MELIFKPFFDDRDYDLFIIEKRHHDGSEWYEDLKFQNGPHTIRVKAFRKAARIIPDSDLEGSRQQMLKVARAIIGRYSDTTKHCAVSIQPDGYLIWSPRCTNGDPYKLDWETADNVADQILTFFKDQT